MVLELIMEKKMETTEGYCRSILYRGARGIMEKKMKTTI